MQSNELRIQANEFRIGNLITVNDVIQEICELPLPENCTDENTKPIHINEKWLIKLGFQYSHRHGQRVFYNIGRLTIEIGIGKHIVYFNDYPMCFKEYVHEIQNLFFGITGSELKVAS